VDVVVEAGVGQAEVAAALPAVVAAGRVEVAAALPAVVAAGRVVAVVAAGRVVALPAEGAQAVTWEVLTGIIPAAFLSVTTRWLPYRILFAHRTASGP
jgi:hypothetical protein